MEKTADATKVAEALRCVESPSYLGIDPGISGGIALIDTKRNAVAWSMPKTERDLCDLFVGISADRKIYGAIEVVHAMPKQGVTSTFTFGVNYGALRMALIAHRIAFEEIRPQKWQNRIGCPKAKKDKPRTQHKKALKGKAQQLFPDIAVTLATADALLIAEWLRREETR